MLAPANCRYVPIAGDASFRRYFRVQRDTGDSVILMDAPPDRETPAAFAEVTRRLLGARARAPRIYHADIDRGFLLLEDFGDDLYLSRAVRDNADRLYRSAIDMLIRVQSADHHGLPAFDADTMRRETNLFIDWLLVRHLDMKPRRGDMQIYDTVFARLIENALEQPQTFVHRDYHSRNLFAVATGDTPGIVDYQDAVVGPVSYDLASLLKDCYIEWSPAKIRQWTAYFLRRYRDAFGGEFDEKVFTRWLDLMGMQRHFKASGIFARLYHRDGKRGYLKDIPRTLGYIRNCSARYSGFAELTARIDEVLRATRAKQR